MRSQKLLTGAGPSLTVTRQQEAQTLDCFDWAPAETRHVKAPYLMPNFRLNPPLISILF